MSTMTRRGRKPTKFYRGRIPNANLQFIYNQKGQDLRVIQKAYHNKYGVWLRESTIESALRRYTPMKNEATTKDNNKSVVKNTKSNKVTVTVSYKGNTYTPLEYLDVRENEAKIDLFTALNG
jgi:hypothetical protein